MEKRKITIDDFVYQITYAGRIPSITERNIISITRTGHDVTRINFMEVGEKSAATESYISYTFRDAPWVERDRGESFYYSCVYDSDRYCLSLEEAKAKLQECITKQKQIIYTEIKQLESIGAELQDKLTKLWKQ